MSPWSPVSWAVALGVLIFCLAIGGVFPKLLIGTGLILRERAPASFLSGVAIVPAAALFCFLLMLTVVGILAIPLVVAALLVFALIGNAAVFNLIGESVAPKLGQKPYALYLWITMGALICWILYCIPVIGFVAGSVVFLAGLGAFTESTSLSGAGSHPRHTPRQVPSQFPRGRQHWPLRSRPRPALTGDIRSSGRGWAPTSIDPGAAVRNPRTLSSHADSYPRLGLIPLRDVRLAKHNPGGNRFEPAGTKARWYNDSRRLFHRTHSRALESPVSPADLPRVHLDSV